MQAQFVPPDSATNVTPAPDESPLQTLRRRLREVAGDRPFISIWPDTARILQRSRSSVYRMANDGVLPTVRHGRMKKVSVIALERFIIDGNGSNR
jgi:predicted DNA-binding transcriptional regulator AlpA